MNTIFLDASVLARISKDSATATRVARYINENGYSIVVGPMTLVELYRRPGQKWDEIIEFLSSVSFCIAHNPDGILDAEVSAYPNEVVLPVNFCTSDYKYTQAEIKDAIETNMRGKIAEFDDAYRKIQHSVWQSILDNRNNSRPDNGNSYSNEEREAFLQRSTLSMAFLFHSTFLTDLNEDGGTEINIKVLKSVYIQALERNPVRLI